ncbi:MAG TPA: hypothetical protein VHH57_08810 [Gaiella sp.]|nr:hypothetical protein [Gaiella sp.]
MDWAAKRSWATAEHERRAATPAGPDEREDFRLAGIAGASWAAGLASLMLGDQETAASWLRRAAEEYATSWHAAPPGSWGRPIAMIRCRLMAGDVGGARDDATAAVEAGALDAAGPIGGYCAALALLVLGRDDEAEAVARRIAAEGLQPIAVAHALAALGRGDAEAFADARRAVLASFEERDAFLEDMPVADTVFVLDALSRARRFELSPLLSPLLSPAES